MAVGKSHAAARVLTVWLDRREIGKAMQISRKRLVAILSIGVLATCCVWFYTQYFLLRPMGSGPAGPAVDKSAFSSEWSQTSVCLIGLGDSITAGLGAASPDHSFFNRLLQNPRDEFPDMRGICLAQVLPNITSENLAISGSNSLEHLSTIENRLTPQSPNVFGLVVMTSGGNDLIHSYGRSPPREGAMYGATFDQAKPWIDAYRARLDSMYAQINHRFPGGCEIFIADIYDPTDGVGDAPSVYLPHWPDGLLIHARYNQAIHAFANEHRNVHVVPLHSTFLGHGSHCRQFWRSTYASEDPSYWYYDNIEDPNDRGYDAIRRAFLKEIAKHTSLRRFPGNASEGKAE